MDDKKSMSWWDFAMPQDLKDKVDAVANRLKLDDDTARKLLDKIAPPHVAVEMDAQKLADEIVKAYTLRTILEQVDCADCFDAYAINQPDDMDESESGGLWDMAGDIAIEFCPLGYTDSDGRNLDDECEKLQSLLYNLLATYRVEIGGDDVDK